MVDEAELRSVRGVVRNPFVLSLYVEALPTLREQHKRGGGGGQARRLRKLDIYDAFVEHWFARGAEKPSVRAFLKDKLRNVERRTGRGRLACSARSLPPACSSGVC